MVSELLAHGFGVPAIGGMALHITSGVFFACSGVNKLTNPARHATFVHTLVEDKVPFLSFNQWWVPSWELLGGIGLALDIASALFAAILFIIIAVALCCEGAGRVKAFAPINKADTVADWLYLQETLYAIILGAIILGV